MAKVIANIHLYDLPEVKAELDDLREQLAAATQRAKALLAENRALLKALNKAISPFLAGPEDFPLTAAEVERVNALQADNERLEARIIELESRSGCIESSVTCPNYNGGEE
jgi:uncharacterized coiled-coil protein SlyX